MTRKAWLEYLQKAVDEFDWDAVEQEQGEPVAWLKPEWGEAICPEVGYEITMTDDHPRDLGWTPLYAHPPHKIGNIGCLGMPVNVPVTPPQSTWVGLTDEETMQIWGGIIKYAPGEVRLKDFARAIEAKLKEKNT